jgi:hypothetical protein
MPQIKTYDYLFDSILESLCQRIPESHAKDLGVAILRSKQIIIDEYERLRDAVKKQYMEDGLECFIDRHKCGACFMLAFENYLFIEPDEDDKDDRDRYEIYREKVAIVAGLTVLGTFVIGDAIDKSLNGNKPEIVRHLEENGGFVIPKPICDELSYETIFAMRLRDTHHIYNTHYNSQDVSVILFIADSLFWIENHNKELVKGA